MEIRKFRLLKSELVRKKNTNINSSSKFCASLIHKKDYFFVIRDASERVAFLKYCKIHRIT